MRYPGVNLAPRLPFVRTVPFVNEMKLFENLFSTIPLWWWTPVNSLLWQIIKAVLQMVSTLTIFAIIINVKCFFFLVKTTVESRETDYAAQCCSFSYIYLARHYWAGTSNLFLQFPFTLYKEDCQIFFYWKSNGQIKQNQLQSFCFAF